MMTPHERKALELLSESEFSWINITGRILGRYEEMHVPGSTIKSLLSKGFIERCPVGAKITAAGIEELKTEEPTK